MQRVYVFLFMGQSNMAGRGVAGLAPEVPEGWGYEYRAVTRPDALVPAREPFGAEENNPHGVFEPGMKTGSLVSAFINSAYPLLGVPIVGVSCSKGGSSINEWEPGGAYHADALARLRKCRDFLCAHDYEIMRACMVWCQGCTDGDNAMPPGEYREKTGNFIQSVLSAGVDFCFLIQIGNHRDNPLLYRAIQEEQEYLCANNANIVMVSRLFKTFAGRGLMKDEFHYLQPAYNEVGCEAGKNAARFLLRVPRGHREFATGPADGTGRQGRGF
ncbi:MAG: sialate O-acetylesterase [Spirochaetia bacterium]|jgi:hypothetical protein|nr:sialate O-acetylesterase [Spirochaetia bacterium]